MVKKGDEWKDLEILILYRIKNLRAAMKNIVENEKPKKRGKALIKISGRISELKHMKVVIHGDIKKASKDEFTTCKRRERAERKPLADDIEKNYP